MSKQVAGAFFQNSDFCISGAGLLEKIPRIKAGGNFEAQMKMKGGGMRRKECF